MENYYYYYSIFMIQECIVRLKYYNRWVQLKLINKNNQFIGHFMQFRRTIYLCDKE